MTKTQKNTLILGALLALFLLAIWQGKAYLKRYRVLTFDRPTAILTMDYGSSTDYSSNFPYLKERGIAATSFISGSLLDSKGYLTSAQIQEMAKQGWDFQCNLYELKNLEKLNEKELKEQLKKNNAVFKKLGLPKPLATAAPFGKVPRASEKIVLKERSALRLGWRKPANQSYAYRAIRQKDLKGLYAVNLDLTDRSKDRMKHVREVIDAAKNRKGLLIFYFHRTTKENPVKFQGVREQYLREIVDYLIQSGYNFTTIRAMTQYMQ